MLDLKSWSGDEKRIFFLVEKWGKANPLVSNVCVTEVFSTYLGTKWRPPLPHKKTLIIRLLRKYCPILLTSFLLPHLSSSLTDSLPSLNLLCQSKTHARFMLNGRKAVWSIPYVSVAFFPSLKHNFIAYRSSKVSDCIFEIHQLWQSGFSRVYSNSCCSCSFEA